MIHTDRPMTGCGNEDDSPLARLRVRQTRVLLVVLALNALLFVGEFTAGWRAGATVRPADSLDMLGDSLVYGLSLTVIAHGARARMLSAGLKGLVMPAIGVLSDARTAYRNSTAHGELVTDGHG